MRDKISKMKSDQSVRLLDRASKMCNDGKISTNHFKVFEKYISDQLNFEEIALGEDSFVGDVCDEALEAHLLESLTRELETIFNPVCSHDDAKTASILFWVRNFQKKTASSE